MSSASKHIKRVSFFTLSLSLTLVTMCTNQSSKWIIFASSICFTTGFALRALHTPMNMVFYFGIHIKCRCCSIQQKHSHENLCVQFSHLMQHTKCNVFGFSFHSFLFFFLLLKNFDVVSNWVANPMFFVCFFVRCWVVVCGAFALNARQCIELKWDQLTFQRKITNDASRIWANEHNTVLRSITLEKKIWPSFGVCCCNKIYSHRKSIEMKKAWKVFGFWPQNDAMASI